MQAIILAGGKGTRLNPIISDIPKPMASVNKRPFLEYLLNYWILQDVDQFFISVGHLADQICYYFGNNYRGCPISYVQEEKPLGTGGALLFALDHLDDTEEAVLVLNGDSFCDVELSMMLQQHTESQAAVTIALITLDANSRYSGVTLQDKRIVDFKKRESSQGILTVNAGVYLLYPEVCFRQKWDIGDSLSLEDDLFPALLKAHPIGGFVTEARFIDIGLPEDYLRAQEFFNQGSFIS